MDSYDDRDLILDANGVCNYCLDFDLRYMNTIKKDKNKEELLDSFVRKIRNERGNSKYDCILGISGGVDSTYLAHLVSELDLNPLVVHYDNGWNSEKAVSNIENIVRAIGLDYYSYVNDWIEIKGLQRSFIKASVIDIELITDQAILALLLKMAYKHKVKYILTGHNHSTEGILPRHWYHWKIDVGNIIGINNHFDGVKLKTYPKITFPEAWWRSKFNPVNTICLLDYINYNKEEAKKFLLEKYSWKDYGGKHYESVFTRFYQGYILPKKFKIDKRKAHLSTLICAGQMSREEALKEFDKPVYDNQLMEEDREFVIKKLEFTEEEFEMYMKIPPVDHLHYSSYFHTYYRWLKWLGKDVSAFIK